MESIRFVYWNTDKKSDTQEEVLENLFETDARPDVLLLGECEVGLTPDFLRKHEYEAMLYSPMEREKPTQRMYTRQQANLRLTHLTTHEDYEDDPISGVDPPHRFLQSEPDFVTRVALMQLEVAGECTLLASVHLPSRRMGAHDESSLSDVASYYKNFIIRGQQFGNFERRIIIVGDFNMNPFDLGMLQHKSFHAINSRAFVRPTRDSSFVPEWMFYNPCWALLSDIDPLQPAAPRLPGSLFFASAPSKRLYWHLYDQVLLSHALMHRLDVASLRIAPYEPLRLEGERGGTTVKTAGEPPKKERRYSLHLPLCFTIQLGTHVV